jgi:hypothetical protein
MSIAVMPCQSIMRTALGWMVVVLFSCVALATVGCYRQSPLPPGLALKLQKIDFMPDRTRFGAYRSVVPREGSGWSFLGSGRKWQADVDVFEGSRALRTRCVRRPVREGVPVPKVSADADPDPELVCWTLSDTSPTQLALVLGRKEMTGFIVVGERRLTLAPTDGGSALLVTTRDGKPIAVLDTTRGCNSEAYFDDALDDETKTALVFAASALVWSRPYQDGGGRSSNKC